MTPDPLLLFPLAALVLVVLYPSLGRSGNVPGSLGDRARRRQLLGRAAVVTLLVAAAVSALWPLWPDEPLGESLQALLIVVAVMLPLVIAHIVFTRHQRRRLTVTGAMATAPDASRRLAVLFGEPTPARIARKRARARDPAPAPDPEGWNLTALRREGTDEAVAEPDPARDGRRGGHEAVRAQLERLVERVDSHDLGEESYSLGGPGPAAPPAVPAPSRAREVTATDTETTSALRAVARELRGMRGREIVGLVHALRTDRSRLRKLVIAQQAARASERRTLERTRAVARDAVSIMHHARASQKLAEKVARRERRERLRVEAKYERVARALDNAVSIIRSGRYPRAGVAAKREALRPDADAKRDRTLETH